MDDEARTVIWRTLDLDLDRAVAQSASGRPVGTVSSDGGNLDWDLAKDLRAGDRELVALATGAPVSSPGARSDRSTAGATRTWCSGGLAAEIDHCVAKIHQDVSHGQDESTFEQPLGDFGGFGWSGLELDGLPSVERLRGVAVCERLHVDLFSVWEAEEDQVVEGPTILVGHGFVVARTQY
jgi:hypothetical protein